MSGSHFILEFCIWTGRATAVWGAALIIGTLFVMIATPSGAAHDLDPVNLGAKIASVGEFIICAIAWVYEDETQEGPEQ